MRPRRGQLLVVEGLHGFHRDTTRGIPPESQFRVYIEAICQLKDRKGNFVPWTDIRDPAEDGAGQPPPQLHPAEDRRALHYVRASEKAHIVPFIKDADVVVNGYLPYELPVHKTYLPQPEGGGGAFRGRQGQGGRLPAGAALLRVPRGGGPPRTTPHPPDSCSASSSAGSVYTG